MHIIDPIMRQSGLLIQTAHRCDPAGAAPDLHHALASALDSDPGLAYAMIFLLSLLMINVIHLINYKDLGGLGTS